MMIMLVVGRICVSLYSVITYHVLPSFDVLRPEWLLSLLTYTPSIPFHNVPYIAIFLCLLLLHLILWGGGGARMALVNFTYLCP